MDIYNFPAQYSFSLLLIWNSTRVFLGECSHLAPLAGWRTTGRDSKAGETWTSLMRSVQVLAWCQAGKTKVCPSNCWVSNNCLTVLSNWVKWTPWSSSLHVTEWHWMSGSQHRGQDITLGCKGDWASTFRVEPRWGSGGDFWCLLKQYPRSSLDF